MEKIFAGIHIQNKPNEFMPLSNIDFERNVLYLKEEIAGKIEYDANNLELVYNGTALDDEQKLLSVMRPNSTVHCFRKTKQYTPYQPHDLQSESQVQELFNVTSHIQINVNSRVNILQKVLAEYPEFRRNLAAQALIRDSVLFNTLHQPEVIENICKHYPIICEAAPYIVDTIKKELTRNTANTNFSEPATDSTNSSEEENSLGASSSAAANSAGVTGGDTTPGADGAQSEDARIRMISRQQLQAALQQIGLGSVNSLSNIAQRNSDTDVLPSAPSNISASSSGSNIASAPPLSSSASGDRISSSLFRSELQRALRSLYEDGTNTAAVGGAAGSASNVQSMDTTETADANAFDTAASEELNGDIPARYRQHQHVEQLRTMAQMGFTNYEENLTYLNITNGNIENAINLIMGSMN